MTSLTDRSTSDPGMERLQNAAGEVAGEARRTADRTAARILDQAADAIDQLCSSLRSAEDQLRGNQPQLADLLDTAVTRVDGVGDYLRAREPGDVLDDAQAAARQQPAIVVGGGLLLGLALGRLLRTTADGSTADGRWSSRSRVTSPRDNGPRYLTSGRTPMVGTMDVPASSASGASLGTAGTRAAPATGTPVAGAPTPSAPITSSSAGTTAAMPPSAPSQGGSSVRDED
jgi:hypothetical protein